MRIVAETVVGILFTLVLTLLFAGALTSIDNPDPASAFLSDGPALIFGGFWIGLLFWVLLVVFGNVLHRNRRPGSRVLHNLLAALVAAILNTVVFGVIGFSAGGWALLLVGIVIMAALAFLLAAAIAIPLTHLLFFRAHTPAPADRAGATPVTAPSVPAP